MPIIGKVKEFIKEYTSQYLSKDKLFEGEGIQKFFENRDTLINYLDTKHNLPTLLQDRREEVKGQ